MQCSMLSVKVVFKRRCYTSRIDRDLDMTFLMETLNGLLELEQSAVSV